MIVVVIIGVYFLWFELITCMPKKSSGVEGGSRWLTGVAEEVALTLQVDKDRSMVMSPPLYKERTLP